MADKNSSQTMLLHLANKFPLARAIGARDRI